tara:strand:- start:6075 stop:6236 length:162 start_codon:yes stop_codon:yes gene_type:complete
MVGPESQVHALKKTVMVAFQRSLDNSNIRRESFISGVLTRCIGARGLGVMTPP